jgi:flagellar biosynthesis chaperone FliJ
MEVAKERHVKAVSELKSVREELRSLHEQYEILINERDNVIKRVEEEVISAGIRRLSWHMLHIMQQKNVELMQHWRKSKIALLGRKSCASSTRAAAKAKHSKVLLKKL